MKNMFLIAGALIIFLVSLTIILAVVNSASKNPLSQGKIKIGENEFRVDIADNIISREKGLSGREKLEDNEGMLFIFGYPSIQSFWMKDMKFPLDIVFIRDHKIVGIAENLPAPTNMFDIASTTSANLTDSVLEVNAGTAKKLGWQAGEEVFWEINKNKVDEEGKISP